MFTCLSPLLDLAGCTACGQRSLTTCRAVLATQVGHRCLLPECVTGGLTGSLPVVSRNKPTYSLTCPGLNTLLTSQEVFKGRQMRHQLGKHAELFGEERLCKSTSFFYWRNKVNDSKLSSLYRACTSQSGG